MIIKVEKGGTKALKGTFKNFWKGFALLFSLSALIAGLAGCAGSGSPEEQLSAEIVKLRIFADKTAAGAYRFVEYSGDKEPANPTVKTIFRIEGFDSLFKAGTEYLISVRKYTNSVSGTVTYNFISIISTAPGR